MDTSTVISRPSTKSKMLLWLTVLWPIMICKRRPPSQLMRVLMVLRPFCQGRYSVTCCRRQSLSHRGGKEVFSNGKEHWQSFGDVNVFHLYLTATKFDLFADHKALEVIFILSSKPLAHIKCWAL